MAMTTIVPDLSDAQLDDLPSRGEAKVYRALRDKLPEDYLVLFQVGWILRREKERARDGETDFLICHPDHGYLCVEVKGGGIGFDAAAGEWFSIDRNRRRHRIKDPVGQALGAKYSVRSKLDEHRRWRALSPGNVGYGHAVFFPDVGNAAALSRPDLPAALVGTATDLEDPRRWIDSVFAYWEANARDAVPLGRRGVEVVRGVFARSFEVAPLTTPPGRLAAGGAGSAQARPDAGPDEGARLCGLPPARRRARRSRDRKDGSGAREGPAPGRRRLPDAAHVLQQAAR